MFGGFSLSFIFHPDPALRVAFQPIVSASAFGVVIYGYEALARDAGGRVPEILIRSRFSEDYYKMDFDCRILAIKTAHKLGLAGNLSLNITPGAVCHADFGVEQTLRFADDIGFPRDWIIFEITEREPIDDYRPIRKCLDRIRENGVRISLDDFGAGFNGLNTLLELRPDVVKVDMGLIRKIENDNDRKALLNGICTGGGLLGMRMVAEGVETLGAVSTLTEFNIDLMQGYYFARPQMDTLPRISQQVIHEVQDALMNRPNVAEAGDLHGALL